MSAFNLLFLNSRVLKSVQEVLTNFEAGTGSPSSRGPRTGARRGSRRSCAATATGTRPPHHAWAGAAGVPVAQATCETLASLWGLWLTNFDKSDLFHACRAWSKIKKKVAGLGLFFLFGSFPDCISTRGTKKEKKLGQSSPVLRSLGAGDQHDLADRRVKRLAQQPRELRGPVPESELSGI